MMDKRTLQISNPSNFKPIKEQSIKNSTLSGKLSTFQFKSNSIFALSKLIQIS